LLYGFNEVLEGRGEKLQEDIENMKEELDSNSPEYMEQMSKIFVNIQAPMREEAEVEKSLKGKTYKDIEIGKKFGGDSGLGEKTFGQLIEEVSNNDFKFFPQKTRNPNYNPLTDDPSEEFLSSSSAAGSFINPQQPTNSQITQDVKNNPQN
jgi:hypothetical protein